MDFVEETVRNLIPREILKQNEAKTKNMFLENTHTHNGIPCGMNFFSPNQLLQKNNNSQ